MSEGKQLPPKWILIVSAFFALLEIMVSIMICISPQTVIDNVDLQAKGVDYLINMWASRQFALGIIFGFASFKKSMPMLSLAYIFFLVMFIGDAFVGLFQHNLELIYTAIVMSILSAAILYSINKKK